MRKRYGIAIMLVALTTLLLMSVPAAAPARTSLSSYEKQVVKLVNKERAKRHLRALRVNMRLVRAARSHSGDMGKNQFFAHDSSNGQSWSKRIIRNGYKRTGCRYWKAGENIYYGSGLYSSPYVVVKAWMRSSAHRRVILTKNFRDVGAGAVKCEDGYGECNGAVWFFTLDVGRRIAR